MKKRKMTVDRFTRRFELIKQKLANDRDALRALMYEAEDILEASDRAVDAITEAADALSEYL